MMSFAALTYGVSALPKLPGLWELSGLPKLPGVLGLSGLPKLSGVRGLSAPISGGRWGRRVFRS